MLPIFQTDSKDISLLQTNWAQQLNPLLSNPVSSGLILKKVSLTSGDNIINHLLGRKLQGWFIVRKRAGGNFYDKQDTNMYPDIQLILNSDASVSVDIYVF